MMEMEERKMAMQQEMAARMEELTGLYRLYRRNVDPA